MLLTDLDQCIETFFSAPTGKLMYYYTQGFSTFVKPGQGKAILEFVERCQKRAAKELGNDPSTNWHRIYVLPAVTASHQLGSATDELEARELRNLIRDTSKASLDPKSGLFSYEIGT